MSLVDAYIDLGLQIGRHIPGFVDAYYGPPDLRERTHGSPLANPAELAASAAVLIEELDADGFEPQRRRWLHAQLAGLHTVARKLAGAEIQYSDEVELCYGTRPARVPESAFAAAHAELEGLLPRNGTLSERYRAWLEARVVPREQVKRVLDSIAADLRGRTARLVGLPQGEEAEVELVSDEPWTAFNYYLGGLRSRIAVNTDLPTHSTLVAQLVTHEIYPGHHTEHATKEQLLVRDQGCLEESVLLAGTPQSLVSEGIAGVGVEVLLEEEPEALGAEHLERFAIELDAEEAGGIRRAREILAAVPVNAALLLYEDGATEDEAREYLMTWGLVTKPRAQQQLEFITDPVWRTYVSTYTQGVRLCRGFVKGDPKRFRRLLTEQLTPADLESAAGS